MKNFYSKARKYLPLFSIFVFILTLISLIIYIVFQNNVAFADFFNYNICYPVRVVLSWLTSWLPFSTIEITLYLSPLILILLIVLAVRNGKKGKQSTIRYLSVLISFLCIIRLDTFADRFGIF